MNRSLATAAICSALAVSAPSGIAAELVGTAPLPDIVSKVAVVTLRDGSGRAQRFGDVRSREFAVKYDSQQRVQAVEATLRPHVSDIVSIGYAPDGKVVGVKFRTGYMMFFDNQSNGTQVIRDSYGGALRRTGRATTLVPDASAEESDKLAASVAQFESLMTALGQPLH